MKQAIEKLLVKTENGEKLQNGSTMFMILLFLAFWSVSFYVLINSMA